MSDLARLRLDGRTQPVAVAWNLNRLIEQFTSRRHAMKKEKAKRPDTRRERALRRDVANAQAECARLRQASANLEGLRQRAVSSAATTEANLQAELSRLRGEVASQSRPLEEEEEARAAIRLLVRVFDDGRGWWPRRDAA